MVPRVTSKYSCLNEIRRDMLANGSEFIGNHLLKAKALCFNHDGLVKFHAVRGHSRSALFMVLVNLTLALSEACTHRTKALVGRSLTPFPIQQFPCCCMLQVLDHVVRNHNDIGHKA
jgi:hypothetical protein